MLNQTLKLSLLLVLLACSINTRAAVISFEEIGDIGPSLVDVY
jgi:hypothetical protein